MAGQPVILAVDIGTSGARAILFDASATHRAPVRKPYPTDHPHPGWSEQDPDTVAEAVIGALKEAVASIPTGHMLAGIVFSSQMYSVLALDDDGRPLSRSLTWGDTRSAGLADTIRETAPTGIHQRTGCPIQAIYPLAKIMWLRTNLKLGQKVRFVSIKDYVVFRLTGRLIADWSTASASGLLNIASYEWDTEALAICQISADQLPTLVSPRHIMTYWRPEISRHIGIPADTPLIMGGGDAPLANIGVGATGAGTLAVNLGTSGAARVLIAQPKSDVEGRLWTYVADAGRWTMGGIIGSAGAVYEWVLKKLLFGDRDLPVEMLFQMAEKLAEGIPAGADGLLFVPYFSGEQSPGWNPGAKGMVHGITLRHEAGHYVRAAMEGIIFALLRVARTIEAVRGRAIEKVYVTGGLATSPLWQRTIADIFGAAVVLPHSPEGSARGAAILGWLALGLADSYEAFAQPETPLPPDAPTHAYYEERFAVFCSLNHHLRAFLTETGG
jgi:gluconokinase